MRLKKACALVPIYLVAFKFPDDFSERVVLAEPRLDQGSVKRIERAVVDNNHAQITLNSRWYLIHGSALGRIYRSGGVS